MNRVLAPGPGSWSSLLVLAPDHDLFLGLGLIFRFLVVFV